MNARRKAIVSETWTWEEYRIFESQVPESTASIAAISEAVDAARDCVLASSCVRQLAEEENPAPERVANALRLLVSAHARAEKAMSPAVRLELCGAIPTTEQIAGLDGGDAIASYTLAAYHHAKLLLFELGGEPGEYDPIGWECAREMLLGRAHLRCEPAGRTDPARGRGSGAAHPGTGDCGGPADK